jgi:RNA polymerase sigma-70 factor (ECF subfamily)
MTTTAIVDLDREITERAREGEPCALTELTNKYRHRIFSVINRMIDNEERAEELTYETFLRAFKNLKSFRGDAKFSSWLYRIAVNLALGERARKKIEQVSLDAIGGLSSNPATSPEYVYQNLFYGEVIDQALAQLPARYALALRLFYLRGLGYVEIAEAMKIPIGTVKTYLHRGKRALRAVVTGKYRPEELL